MQYILIFFLGAAIGSFLNVMISRSLEGEAWVKGRSRCDHCGKVLAWYDMIPLLSYLAYRGRSRCCRKSLSMQHPIVEALTGTLFVWWLAVGTLFFNLVAEPLSTLQPLFWLLIGLLLTGILVTDLFYGMIPTLFVGAGLVLVILYRVALGWAGVYNWQDLAMAVLAALLSAGFFGLLRILTRGKGMGEGDVILALLLGLLLGWPRMVVGILASFVLGAAVAVVLVALGQKKMGSTVPFGPFMVAGIIVALIYGDQIWRSMGLG